MARATSVVLEPLEERRLLAILLVTNVNDAGPGSLRQAILDTYKPVEGEDFIRFDIPGDGPHTIMPLTPLPRIGDLVVLDGFSQPGADDVESPPGITNAVVKIELNGAAILEPSDGLVVRGTESTILGLAIGGFTKAGIRVEGGDAVLLLGNFIGTDAAGTAARPNRTGIAVESRATKCGIGTSFGGSRSVISGNDLGVDIRGRNCHVNALIGVDRTGQKPLPNHTGIVNSGDATEVFQSVVSGNSADGIVSKVGISIKGSRIGTDFSGKVQLPNNGDGVRIEGGSDSLVGMPLEKPRHSENTYPNHIAFNKGAGVRVISPARGVVIRHNSIHDNQALGIDLAGGNENAAGVTANDARDPDEGSNLLQNFPVLNPATTNGLTTQLTGTLNSSPNQKFRIDFYGSPTADPSGHGEGAVWLSEQEVTTDGNGNANFNFTLPPTMEPFISATATRIDSRNTSEFSPVVVNNRPRAHRVINNNDSGLGSLREAFALANSLPGFDGIVFELPPDQTTITPLTPFPPLTGQTLIDATTQPGYLLPVVELNGQNFGPAGIELPGDSMIRGMTINNFDDAAVILGGVGRNSLIDSHVGTDVTGTLAVPNGVGVRLSFGNLVFNSLISGNHVAGILLAAFSDFNFIAGNRIGTAADGQSPLPNGVGVSFNAGSPFNNRVERNTIAFNAGAGIAAPVGMGNRFSANSIFANGGLGIDIGPVGPTANDPGDADTGGNGGQNFGMLTAAFVANSTRITGTLNSKANGTYTLEFFANPPAGPQRFLGSANVTTNAAGDASFDVTVSGTARHGETVTATASGNEGTSEFSPPVNVVDQVAPQATAAEFLFERGPLAVRVTFSEDVSASLQPQDLVVTRIGSPQPITPGEMIYDPDTNQATFLFLDGLPDGDYRATFAPGGVSDPAGNALAAGFAFDFFVLAADANRDRTVGFADLVALAQNYGATGKSFSDGDFSGDGDVDFEDLVMLAQRYNTSLPAPASAPGAPVTLGTQSLAAARQPKRRALTPASRFEQPALIRDTSGALHAVRRPATIKRHKAK